MKLDSCSVKKYFASSPYGQGHRETPVSKFENMPHNLIAPIYSHKLYDEVCNLEFYLRVCVMMHVVWKTTESTEQKRSLPNPHPLPSLTGRKVFIGYYSLLRAYTDDLSGILRGKAAFCSCFRSRLPLQIIISLCLATHPIYFFPYSNIKTFWHYGKQKVAKRFEYYAALS